MPRRKTPEEFVEELGIKNPSVIALDPYVNSGTKLHFQCKKCGTIWETIPETILSNHGCPNCSRKAATNKTRKTHEQFLRDIEQRQLCIVPLENYNGAKGNIEFLCKKCGHRWVSYPNMVLTGHGCPKCGRDRIANALSSSDTEFREKLNSVNPDIEAKEVYTRSNRKILCECKICGNNWRATPNNLLHGYGCPKCNLVFQSSFPEQAVYFYVRREYPDAKNKYKEGFENTEIDIYIPEIKCGIEYDGAAWHSSSYKKEVKKYKKAKELGIFLIRIREEPLTLGNGEICDKAFSVNYDDNNYESLAKCILELMLFLDNSYSCKIDIKQDIAQIREQYYSIRKENSLAEKFPEIAKQWNQEKNGSITPLMVPAFSGSKFWWTCPDCGYEWQTLVSTRTRNKAGCPRCSGYIAKSTDSFIRELALIDDSIIPIDSYITALTPIRFQCLNCNHIWMLTPSHALDGRGCPNCRKEEKNKNYYQKVSLLHPNIDLISDYCGNTKRIKCRCNICGYEWSAVANTLLRKTGCPQCEGKFRKTNNYFTNELKEKAPNLIAVDEYISAQTPIRFKCLICGTIWSAKPNTILSGSGCPKCNSSTKTQEQFIEELFSKAPTVTALDKYQGGNTPIRFKCKKCGFEWNDKPLWLLRRKYVCPQCKLQLKHPNLKTTEQFIEEMKRINPNIEILSEYKGVHKPIDYRCLICGTIQSRTPNELRKGRGCRMCKKTTPKGE